MFIIKIKAMTTNAECSPQDICIELEVSVFDSSVLLLTQIKRGESPLWEAVEVSSFSAVQQGNNPDTPELILT